MKLFFQNIKLIILGIVVAIGASYAYASSVAKSPTAPSPWNNLFLPVHQLTGVQVKTGNLSVNGFSAYENSSLEQDSFFGGILKGVSTGGNTSTVVIGGAGGPVVTKVNGSVSSTLALGSSDLVNTSDQAVCGDVQGHFVLCGGSGPAPFCGDNNIDPGEQCDDGNNINGDGCSSTCQNESWTTSVEYINATSQPVMGGTGNTNVVCSASLSASGASANITIRYHYTFRAGGGDFIGSCSVFTDASSGNGTDYPGQEYYGQDVSVTSTCLEGADVPVSPTVTRC